MGSWSACVSGRDSKEYYRRRSGAILIHCLYPALIQNSYIIMPSVSKSPIEAHPFTIAGIPDKSSTRSSCDQVQFILHVQNGFTKHLFNKTNDGRTRLTTFLDGPYGSRYNFAMYHTVFLVAGGSGITHSVSHLLDLIRRAKKGVCDTRHVQLLWMVRDTGESRIGD